MKTITFYYDHRSGEQYRAYLEFLCMENPEELVIYSIFSRDFKGKAPGEIAEIQQQVTKNKRIRFRNHCVFRDELSLSSGALKAIGDHGFRVELLLQSPVTEPKKLFSAVKKLTKHGITLTLWSEGKDQRYIYEVFRSMGLSVSFPKPEYTPGTKAWFDHWVYDKGAVGVNTFTDIMAMVLLGIRSHNCRYGSCMGNTYYADGEGRLYLCPMHPGEETCLGTIKELGYLSKSYEQPATYRLLLPCVAKREQCMKNCGVFPYCHGGCPLAEEQGADCSLYGNLVAHIGQTLLEIWEKDRLGDVNPVIRSAILNAMAFDSAFIRS